MVDTAAALKFIDEAWDSSVRSTLEQFVRIENQSPQFDPEWATNGLQEKAFDLLVNWAKSQNVPGISIELLRLPGRTPLLFIEFASTSASAQTVLLYGHADKQPPMTEAWRAGLHPHQPVLEDGKLYGRGVSDDGYAIFAALLALQILKRQSAEHARGVLLIEGSEESGSPDLQAYVEAFAERIGKPALVVCLDSGCGNYEQLWLTTSLRGVLIGTLDVRVLTEAVHSGQASGIVPSSFRIIRQLLDRIEDSRTGRVLLPQLDAGIPDYRLHEAEQTAAVLGSLIVDEFPWAGSTRPLDGSLAELLLNRTWRSTVSVTGADGLPSLPAAGNVLRTGTRFKLSVRLPPNVAADVAAQALKRELERDPPYGASVSFTVNGAANGWDSPASPDWLLRATQDASQRIFGKPALAFGEGGSIPFMGMLGAKFPDAKFIITGVLGPSSNAHGPNEFLHIDMFKRVTASIAWVLHAHAVNSH